MSNNIRLRTTPNGTDKYLQLPINQDFDFIEVLSLKISQDQAYQTFCSDYGVIVGRVVVNSGFGIPNAKVSVFIPISNEDSEDPTISGLYPYKTVNDKDSNGIRYNLLPKESDSNNDCYTPVGTFPAKREILDNNTMLEVYNRYYKYSTTTNYAGDFMLFGVPLGSYVVHVDADISNIGIGSQRPYDLIDQGTPSKFFYSPTKFKDSKNLNSLVQVKSANVGVNVQPFWGDLNNCEIGINRIDIDLNYQIRPAAIFMGSIFGDSRKNSVNKQCRPRKDLGQLCQQIAREGTIEMIRKTIDGEIEQFDIEGGRVIDSNGAWAYQIPMNLDYVVTDEFGNLVPSEDENKGIPTRSRVRFRIGMDEGGGTGRLRIRGKYLVPHNPENLSELDYNFDATTKESSFVDLYWNKIYTVKNFISKVEKAGLSKKAKTYVGIKDVDGCVGDKTPFPFNRAYTKSNILFTVICFILTLVASIVSALNKFLCWIRGIKIVRWRPFKSVNPISMKCPSDPETTWTPGCGNSVSDFTDCISAVLAEELGVFQFDFYNDWINGTLYYYLLKYKKKRRGREKFCETNCNDYQGGTGNNDCKTNQLADGTVDSENNNFTHSFRNGLLVKYQDELYYPPILLDGSNMKLFPTDIINLGAVLNCDWQGIPKIVQYLTNTSYNLPPLIQEIDDEDGSTVTGMIEIGNLYTGLFFDINCVGVSFNGRQATNMRRLSELYVDLPEVQGGQPHATVTINEIYDRNDAVDVVTSVNKYVRDVYTQLNIQGPENPYYPVINIANLNQPNLGTSFEYDGNTQNPTHNDGSAYNTFRNFKFPQGGFNDMGFQSWGNSYYIYFGLIPGKTALDKLNSKYFTHCIRSSSDDYIIDTTVTNSTTFTSNNGVINFIFIGGTPPFRYRWTGTNYDSGEQTTNSSGVITNLPIGVYTITATDSLGTIVTKNVNVDGPQPLICGFSVFTNPSTQSSSNGAVNITQIIGGQGPYALNVSGPVNLTFNNITTANSPITNLPPGNYTFTVTDSSSPIQTCISTLELTAAPALSFTIPIQYEDVSCNANCDGGISPRLNGGLPPYSVSVTGPNGYSNSGLLTEIQLNNLCEGTYTVTGTDSVSPTPQSVTTTVTLVKPTPPSINIIGINNSKQCNPSSTTIKFNLVQGGTPFPYTITYEVDGVQNQVQTSTAGLNTLVITQPITSLLTISVSDSGECDTETLQFGAQSIQRPSSVLSLGGSRVGNNITYNATGGIPPYTYTPVNSGQFNTYTAPNANPVTAVVTDSVGCTASASF
jgi:hypothetical protein